MINFLPNLISLTRIFLVFPIIFFIIYESYHLALAVFFVASFTDFFDGYLARKYSVSSELGAFLDLIADKILVVSLLVWISFLSASYLLTIISLLIILREIMITSFRYLIVLKNKNTDLIKVDKLGKFKTSTQFLAISFLIIHPFFSSTFFFLSIVLLSVSALISYASLLNYILIGVFKSG